MRTKPTSPLRALMSAAITAAVVSFAAPLAHADNQHDCDLLNNADLEAKIQAAVTSMQQTAKSGGGDDLAKNSATTIVAYQNAGDVAGQLAADLQSQQAQATLTKLHDDLYAQAEAFEATIKDRGSQASLDKFKATSGTLKATIGDYKQVDHDACGG
jgi:hypothetical protein